MADWIIASFKITGTNANFLENTRDSIEGGKITDLIVLDKRLFTVPVDEIGKEKVIKLSLEEKRFLQMT